MNLSAAAMLVDKRIRPLRIEYDPYNDKNNNPNKLFKCLDASVKKDDLVVVQTHTRQGFTVAKVIEADFPVDFNSAEQWGWAVKFDRDTFNTVLETEEALKHKVAKAQENKMRKELIEAAGLGEVDFSDVDLIRLGNADKSPETAPTE